MPPAFWISLASVALLVIVQMVAVAFMGGRLFQRVSTLEKRDDVLARLDSTVTRMDANMGHLTQSVDEVKRKLDQTPASRRRAAE